MRGRSEIVNIGDGAGRRGGGAHRNIERIPRTRRRRRRRVYTFSKDAQLIYVPTEEHNNSAARRSHSPRLEVARPAAAERRAASTDCSAGDERCTRRAGPGRHMHIAPPHWVAARQQPVPSRVAVNSTSQSVNQSPARPAGRRGAAPGVARHRAAGEVNGATDELTTAVSAC